MMFSRMTTRIAAAAFFAFSITFVLGTMCAKDTAVLATATPEPDGSMEKLGFAGLAGMLLWVLYKKSMRQDKQQEELVRMLVNEIKETNAAVRELTIELRDRPCIAKNG